MTRKVWSAVTVFVAIALGEAAGWFGARLGVPGRIGRDLIVFGVFGLTLAWSRRVLGLPVTRDPFSDPPVSLTK